MAAGGGVAVGTGVCVGIRVAVMVGAGTLAAVGSGSSVGDGAEGFGAVVGASVGLAVGSSVGVVAWVGSGWVSIGVVLAGCGVGEFSTTAVGAGSAHAARVSRTSMMAGNRSLAHAGFSPFVWVSSPIFYSMSGL